MTKVIIFTFAGRKPNMELQTPFIKRILEDHENAEWHIWNLSRDNGDSKYLQTIKGHRITVLNDFRKVSPGYDEVYKYYAADPQYKDRLFVKLDDDIVFLETARFGAFVEAIAAHRDKVLSANVINNGACTPLSDGMWQEFKKLSIPLLDIHMSARFAAAAHNFFFDRHAELLGQSIRLVPTADWLSINVIGFDWKMNARIAEKVGTRCGTRPNPRLVAGRPLEYLGDEGMVNTLPRVIMRGFVAGHLTFGPQKLTEMQLAPWRERYAEIGRKYLKTVGVDDEALPALSPVSHAQPVAAANWRTRWHEEGEKPVGGFYSAPLTAVTDSVTALTPTGENNPQIGRFQP